MTKEQWDGTKSLKERRDAGELVIYQTDKSAKMAVDTPENYIRCMRPHVEKDTIIAHQFEAIPVRWVVAGCNNDSTTRL